MLIICKISLDGWHSSDWPNLLSQAHSFDPSSQTQWLQCWETHLLCWRPVWEIEFITGIVASCISLVIPREKVEKCFSAISGNSLSYWMSTSNSVYSRFCHDVVTNQKHQPLGTWDRLTNTNLKLNSKPTEDKMSCVSYHKLHKHCISHAAYCQHTRSCLLGRPSSLFLHSPSLSSKPWWHHCEIIQTVMSPSATEAIYQLI